MHRFIEQQNQVADNPFFFVVNGAGKIVEELDFFKVTLMGDC